jgi:hypothetical protein
MDGNTAQCRLRAGTCTTGSACRQRHDSLARCYRPLAARPGAGAGAGTSSSAKRCASSTTAGRVRQSRMRPEPMQINLIGAVGGRWGRTSGWHMALIIRPLALLTRFRGAKLGANVHRHKATSGDFRCGPVPTSGDIGRCQATLGKCLLVRDWPQPGAGSVNLTV